MPIFFLEKRNKKRAYLSNALVVPPSSPNLKRKIKTLRRFTPCHALQALTSFGSSNNSYEEIPCDNFPNFFFQKKLSRFHSSPSGCLILMLCLIVFLGNLIKKLQLCFTINPYVFRERFILFNNMNCF